MNGCGWRKSCAGLNAALENAVEGIAQLDTQGRYVSVNPAYAGMLGHSAW